MSLRSPQWRNLRSTFKRGPFVPSSDAITWLPHQTRLFNEKRRRTPRIFCAGASPMYALRLARSCRRSVPVVSSLVEIVRSKSPWTRNTGDVIVSTYQKQLRSRTAKRISQGTWLHERAAVRHHVPGFSYSASSLCNRCRRSACNRVTTAARCPKHGVRTWRVFAWKTWVSSVYSTDHW